MGAVESDGRSSGQIDHTTCYARKSSVTGA
jgi:hypothetical protein